MKKLLLLTIIITNILCQQNENLTREIILHLSKISDGDFWLMNTISQPGIKHTLPEVTAHLNPLCTKISQITDSDSLSHIFNRASVIRTLKSVRRDDAKKVKKILEETAIDLLKEDLRHNTKILLTYYPNSNKTFLAVKNLFFKTSIKSIKRNKLYIFMSFQLLATRILRLNNKLYINFLIHFLEEETIPKTNLKKIAVALAFRKAQRKEGKKFLDNLFLSQEGKQAIINYKWLIVDPEHSDDIYYHMLFANNKQVNYEVIPYFELKLSKEIHSKLLKVLFDKNIDITKWYHANKNSWRFDSILGRWYLKDRSLFK